MEDDELGFLYPEIDEVKCIKCGLCKKVCSFNSNYDRSANFAEPKVYAVQHKDKNEIELSQVVQHLLLYLIIYFIIKV